MAEEHSPPFAVSLLAKRRPPSYQHTLGNRDAEIVFHPYFRAQNMTGRSVMQAWAEGCWRKYSWRTNSMTASRPWKSRRSEHHDFWVNRRKMRSHRHVQSFLTADKLLIDFRRSNLVVLGPH